MDTVKFVGRVTGGGGINLDMTFPPLTWKWEEAGEDIRVETVIKESTITVSCSVPELKPEYIQEMLKRATDIARVGVNLVAFASGRGLGVIIELMIDSKGEVSRLNYHDPSLETLVTAYSLDQAGIDNFNFAMRAVLTNVQLMMALNDLVECNSVLHVVPINCARVVESIRRMMAPTMNDSQAWEFMRANLNVDRAYLALITDTSTKPRHGNRIFVDGPQTIEILKRGWTVMNRYLEYLKGGGQALEPPNFPPLSG